ncbi:MAG: AIR synthase-related protein, partial [Anaerovorax sp.]
MEVGAVIGAAPAKNVRREVPISGDCIVLVGGRTGRDGCGGATGSSKEHTEDSILNCGAEVQKGNPPVERNIQRLYRREEVTKLIKRCNDFGAGGVSVAIGELADSLDVNLDLVSKKYEGLDGTELAISESQERMAAVVSEKDCKQFIQYAEEENLEAIAVAKVTDTGRFKMFWRGKCILDLSRAFLNTNGVSQMADVEIKGNSRMEQVEKAKVDGDQKELALEFLRDLNCCSQKGLMENFDSTIGAGTVLMPLGGKYQLSPSCGMAAKLPVMGGYTDTTTLMSYGFDPTIAKLSPYHGGLYAVIDSATKIVAMGGAYGDIRLSFQEYFERLGKNPVSWGKPFSALLGALKVQKELGIPAIGGKDSMSGTFMDIQVPPTLISFAVATTTAFQVVSTELKKTDSHLVLVYAKRDENRVIDFSQYRKNMDRVTQLTKSGKILAANTVGTGGVFVSLVKMAVGNQIGVRLEALSHEELFQANYGALLLEIGKEEKVEELLKGATYKEIGETVHSQQPEILGISMDDIVRQWTKPLEKVFPTEVGGTQLGERLSSEQVKP